MTLQAWIAILTLVYATTMLITRWLPIPITALSIPVILASTGVLKNPTDAIKGFGNGAVIAIGAIFVVGAALRESGVATLIARGLQRVGGKSELGVGILMMGATAVMAAFMNNTAVVAILLPVGMVLAKRSGMAPSRLLMPLSFAAVLGGTISLIGTAPNFVVAEYFNKAAEVGVKGFNGQIGIFDYAFVGIPITVVGVLFMAFFGRKLLPTITTEDRLAAAQLPEQVATSYDVPEKLFTLRLAGASALAGKTIAESGVRNEYGLEIVMVRRRTALATKWIQPDPDVRLEGDDVLYVSGDDTAAWGICEEQALQFGLADTKAIDELLGHGTTLAEVTLTPHSPAIGRSFKDMDFRKRFGLNVLALFRGTETKRRGFAEEKLKLGDAFLVTGTPRRVRALARDPDFVVLTDQSQVEDVTRAPLAFLILLVALVPPIVWKFPLPLSGMGAAILMILTRCISRAGLQRCMDWGVLCLLVGTMPLGQALEEQQIAKAVADFLTSIATDQIVVFAMLFVLAAVFSNLASNAAAAVIMAPVAAQAAATIPGMDVKAALLAMAYGCSCNFIVPYSQCNLIVMAPGGYQARDFIKVGLVMAVVMAITTMITLSFM